MQWKDDLLASVKHIQNSLEKTIEKFKQLPSIFAIMKHKLNISNFWLSRVAKQSTESLNKTLDSSKTIQKDNIATKIIKETWILSQIYFMTISINVFQNPFFPDNLKKSGS